MLVQTRPIPAVRSDAQWSDVMVPNYGTPSLTMVRGNGATLQDDQGNMYTDLLGGIATTILGHNHPAINRAVARQVQELLHVSNLYAHPQGLRLAQRLSERTYGHKVLFVNSGTEANEAALKAMRRKAHAEDRSDAVVVAFEGSFHGRTTGSLALTGQPHHQEGCGPLPTNIVHVPFNDPDALRSVFADHDVVGVMVECIQGEGGIHPMTPEFAATLRELTAGDEVLLAIDEVQTGMGRTGTFHAHEQWDLRPDLVTMAKSLGGGLPIGALLASAESAQHLGPGSHGCTFGGNPVAAAAANAVLDTIEQEDLLERAHRLGEDARSHLAGAGIETRGRGLLIGVTTDDAAKALQEMQDAGYLVGQAGKDVVRLAPPLNIHDDAWTLGFTTLTRVLTK